MNNALFETSHYNTANQIIKTPVNEKERNHPSRKRLGYHVYLSRYFEWFNSIPSTHTKKEIMRFYGIWKEEEDDSSVDSVLTQPEPSSSEVMSLAARHWNSMSKELKDCWKERARMLNDRPRNDGTFLLVPTSIVKSSVSQNIIEALSMEWVNLVRIFKGCILSRRGDISPKSYMFGNERVVLYSQHHRTFFLNHLLKVSIFGSPLFSTLSQHELIHRTKRQVVLHLLSHKRIESLFKFGGLSAVTFEKNGMKHLCCGKVNLIRGGKNMIGYIVDEEVNDLKIRIEGEENNVICLCRPEYNVVDGKYIYDTSLKSKDTYVISQLWPVRFKINNSGQASFIISSATFNNEDNLVVF